MKPSVISHSLCVLGLTLSLCLPALAVEVGQAAPSFELPGTKGPLQLSDYRGKTVYLDFWASWCGPCKQSFPWMNDMQKRYGDKGLRIVGVSVDQKAQDAQDFLKKNPAIFDVAFDTSGTSPKTYSVKAMPTSVLIDANGKVLMVHQGFKDESRAELEKQIKQALNLKD